MTKKQKIPEDTTQFKNQTAFRQSERHFKRHFDTQFSTPAVSDANNVFTFPTIPGLVLIRECIDFKTQAQLVQSALHDWSKLPNLSNLDSHFNILPAGIWSQFCKDANSLVEPRLFDSNSPQVLVKDQTPSEKLNLLIDPPTDPKRKQKPVIASAVLKRMRWVTLGYQYNWTAKKYHYDRSPSFPDCLKTIIKNILKRADHLVGTSADEYRCEAGIVNYYHVCY